MKAAELRDALYRALASIDLRARVRDALRALDGGRASRLLAVGKGSGAMVDGAVDAWGDLLGGIVVLPDGAPPPAAAARFQILRASHPLPDERSVAAGEAALEASLHANAGPLLALVSGGASSLVFVPVHASGLSRARGALAALLVSGASVREINVVRRHASLAHGGALASPDAITLLASDVVDGRPEDIGSGPTVPDPTTRGEALAILARYAPAHTELPLRETLKPSESDPRFRRAPIVVVEPGDLAAALARELLAAGFAPRLLAPSTADVLTLARETIDLAATLSPGEACVRSAEPSVRLDPSSAGAGGRCSHLAALVARGLPDGVTFLAAASDGVDGSSGTGGAVVSRDSFPDAAAVSTALAAFDTGPLHRACGTALSRSPTGLNLTDVHALVRAKPAPES